MYIYVCKHKKGEDERKEIDIQQHVNSLHSIVVELGIWDFFGGVCFSIFQFYAMIALFL